LGITTLAEIEKNHKRQKTETLSLRLDPKTRFMLDVLARVGGHSITTVVDRAIREAADRTLIYEIKDYNGNITDQKIWSDYWNPNEGLRMLNLLSEKNYPTNYEEDELIAFTKTHWPFFYTNEKFTNLRNAYVEILWPNISKYLEKWREIKNENFWTVGEDMKKDLSTARVQPPEWPPGSKKTEASRGGYADLDDEIPF
jgi:hypothetical protein